MISVAGRGRLNMLSMRRLMPSKTRSQMICPMYGSTSTLPRSLAMVSEAIPEGWTVAVARSVPASTTVVGVAVKISRDSGMVIMSQSSLRVAFVRVLFRSSRSSL